MGYNYTQVLFVTCDAHGTGPPGFPLVPYPEATSVETSMLPQPRSAVPMVGGDVWISRDEMSALGCIARHALIKMHTSRASMIKTFGSLGVLPASSSHMSYEQKFSCHLERISLQRPHGEDVCPAVTINM